MDIWLHICGLPFEYQPPSIARRLVRHAGEILMVDWANRRPRNIRFMRVRVRIDPWKPLVVGCMLKRTNGVISWVEFQYETIKKHCFNCWIIGHTHPICQHINAKIETMLNAQAATSRRDYGTSEGEENIQNRDDNVEMQQVVEKSQYQQKGDMNDQAVPPDINDEDIVPIIVNDGYNADTEGGSDNHKNQFTPSLPYTPSFGLELVMGIAETRERLLTNTL
ncbi:hypothetical protein COLO4_04339 [Corchorus olitorius]|uniref:Zinc knuckle CX2CX4HX4C domain-containing protein n=1 Tax=Corchorus olitorius TaxID=93759 RepID=A0A1R3KUJ6_9ROSI|nr:hypothetical protein COLO4_04339 [Corchorus olitorius]